MVTLFSGSFSASNFLKFHIPARDRPTRGYPHVGWAPPTRFSYKSHFPRGFWVGINRVISIFTHALFVCVGHEIVIFDTKKVLRVLIRHLLVATMQKVLCWRVHSELLWKKYTFTTKMCVDVRLILLFSHSSFKIPTQSVGLEWDVEAIKSHANAENTLNSHPTRGWF